MGPTMGSSAGHQATAKTLAVGQSKKTVKAVRAAGSVKPVKPVKPGKPGKAGKRSHGQSHSIDQVGPADMLDADSIGLHGQASFYGRAFGGQKTATGEIFDFRQFTAASNRFALGTLVAVHRLDNDRCAIVKVNDRMHNRHRQRVIDVSRGVAEYLDMVRAGVVMVRVVALPGKGARRDAGTCRSAVEAAADWQSADEFSPRRGQPEKMPEIEIGPAD